MTDRKLGDLALAGAAWGLGLPRQIRDATRALADADQARVAYEVARDMVIGGVDPFDDETLIAAVKLVAMVEQRSFSGMGNFSAQLAGLRHILVDWRKSEPTLDGALRRIASESADQPDLAAARARLRAIGDEIRAASPMAREGLRHVTK